MARNKLAPFLLDLRRALMSLCPACSSRLCAPWSPRLTTPQRTARLGHSLALRSLHLVISASLDLLSSLSLFHGGYETIKHLIRGIDRRLVNVLGHHVANLQSQQPRNANTVILPNRDRVGLHPVSLARELHQRNRPFIQHHGGNA